MRWNYAQWSCYNAVRSGIICHNGERLRFITLTSIMDMKRGITDCFKVFVNRIERLCPIKFVELGLIKRDALDYYFPDLGIYDNLRFDYLYVLTSEGASGVLHILYFGDYLNESWLKDNWENITGGARQLVIENVKFDDVESVTRYVVNQNKVLGYVVSQSEYVRHSYSKNWIYKGWRKDFDRLRFFCNNSSRYRDSRLSGDFWLEWSRWLNNGRFRYNHIQLYLNGVI